MGKRREQHNDFNFEDDSDQILDEIFNLDDEDDFFEQFQPRRSRKKSRRSRDARRRIEEYWEDRRLAERLEDYHYRE